jgi:hypothetical protein
VSTTNATATSFLTNTALYGGGAYFNAPAIVTTSRFISNSAQYGGGAYFLMGGVGQAINSLFARNTASIEGSAVDVEGGSRLTLIHATIAMSGPAPGSAIFVISGTLGMTNTIVSGYARGIQRSGGAIYEDYSLFSGVATPYAGTVASGGRSITGTAGFVNPAADDYHLGAGSAAIDAGVNAGIAVDFEGDARPIGARPDIGYDESTRPPRTWLPLLRR